MKFNDKTYNVLKWTCLICLPAVITLTTTVLAALNVPQNVTTSVITIIGAVATFLGTLIGVSCASYNTPEESEEGSCEC